MCEGISTDFLFWSGDAMDCFTPADIQYWWGVAEDVIDDYKPTGKVFINCNYFWDAIYINYQLFYFHRATPVRYGIVNCSGGIEE